MTSESMNGKRDGSRLTQQRAGLAEGHMVGRALLDRLIDRESKLVKIDNQWKRVRLGLFIAAAALSALSSRPAVSATWVVLAGIVWVLFVGLVVLHTRFRGQLTAWRARLDLERDFEALGRLSPRKPTSWSLAGLSDREMRLNRDLDLFQPSGGGSGFSQLFPFFLTDAGARKFRDRILGSVSSASTVRNRQRAIEFWSSHPLLRHRLFRRFGGAQSTITAEHVVERAQLPIVNGEPNVWIGIGATLQAGFWVVWLAAQSGMLPSTVRTVALFVWFGGFFWISRSVDLFGAYPQAMSLASSLRALSAVTLEIERLNKELRSQFQPREDFAKMLAESPSQTLREIERCAGAMGMRQNPLLALVVNVLVPWDLYWATRYEKARRLAGSRIADWLDEIAELESQLALAEWDDHHGVAVPEFLDTVGQSVRNEKASADSGGFTKLILRATDIAHPMIDPGLRVANSFELERQQLHLITGSNMAGKSTFLRAVAMNQLLAQAGARVVARELTTSVFQIESSIKPGDSLSDGYSAFYAEVKDLAEILKSATNAEPRVLYFIDEIFRGTNNRERRAGAEAVIRALTGTPASGFLTTHDLDLAQLESQVPMVRNFHFRDDVHEGKMVFSYRYQRGPCPTTNATRVMAEAGLPVSVS